mgnify:FL=1
MFPIYIRFKNKELIKFYTNQKGFGKLSNTRVGTVKMKCADTMEVQEIDKKSIFCYWHMGAQVDVLAHRRETRIKHIDNCIKYGVVQFKEG